MLVTCIFSFAHNVLYTNKETLCHSSNLSSFPTQALNFTCLQYKSFENTVGKGETAKN